MSDRSNNSNSQVEKDEKMSWDNSAYLETDSIFFDDSKKDFYDTYAQELQKEKEERLKREEPSVESVFAEDVSDPETQALNLATKDDKDLEIQVSPDLDSLDFSYVDSDYQKHADDFWSKAREFARLSDDKLSEYQDRFRATILKAVESGTFEISATIDSQKKVIKSDIDRERLAAFRSLAQELGYEMSGFLLDAESQTVRAKLTKISKDEVEPVLEAQAENIDLEEKETDQPVDNQAPIIDQAPKNKDITQEDITVATDLKQSDISIPKTDSEHIDDLEPEPKTAAPSTVLTTENKTHTRKKELEDFPADSKEVFSIGSEWVANPFLEDKKVWVLSEKGENTNRPHYFDLLDDQRYKLKNIFSSKPREAVIEVQSASGEEAREITIAAPTLLIAFRPKEKERMERRKRDLYQGWLRDKIARIERGETDDVFSPEYKKVDEPFTDPEEPDNGGVKQDGVVVEEPDEGVADLTKSEVVNSDEDVTLSSEDLAVAPKDEIINASKPVDTNEEMVVPGPLEDTVKQTVGELPVSKDISETSLAQADVSESIPVQPNDDKESSIQVDDDEFHTSQTGDQEVSLTKNSEPKVDPALTSDNVTISLDQDADATQINKEEEPINYNEEDAALDDLMETVKKKNSEKILKNYTFEYDDGSDFTISPGQALTMFDGDGKLMNKYEIEEIRQKKDNLRIAIKGLGEHKKTIEEWKTFFVIFEEYAAKQGKGEIDDVKRAA